ncbi:MAG: glycosyltransferase family 4 protein [Pseudomonadales bacterium]|nr:glycosyltransferase family 4 protein [Pseudomonadales bacterium]
MTASLLNFARHNKIAIVHDWLVTYAGAERVLEDIIKLFPSADLFSIIDFLPENNRDFIIGKKPKTTFIQHLPFAKTKYRAYLPLMPLAVEQLDLSSYDIVISSSHAVAKGVITGPDQFHICYCHSPMRYIWDLQHQYLRESNLHSGFKSWIIRYLLHRMRIWDNRTANGVDLFISNSDYIGRRIKKVYGKESTTIYPGIDIERFPLVTDKDDFYFTASRMAPYKKIELIVQAFNEMPDKKLKVIGDGPQYQKIKEIAGANIKLLGFQPTEILIQHMSKAKAFVFAAEEDFGIIPVEAQACGTPVICYGKGGTLETVKPEITGLFFNEQSTNSIITAIEKFDQIASKFEAGEIRKHASTFSKERFRSEFLDIISSNTHYKKHQQNGRNLSL